MEHRDGSHVPTGVHGDGSYVPSQVFDEMPLSSLNVIMSLFISKKLVSGLGSWRWRPIFLVFEFFQGTII